MDAALVDFINGLPSLSCALVSTYDDLADGRAVVEAARIGNGVTIGAGAIIGKSSILSDYVTVAPGAIVPPDTVAPPFALLHGVPAEIVGAMPESALHERRSLVEERVKAQLAAYSSAAVPASPSAR